MSNLPTLAELHHAPAEAFKDDQFLQFVNNQPPESWIKEHPFAAGVKYIPVAQIERNLDMIFQLWWLEVIDYKQLFNSVTCHVRLFYKHPISGDIRHQDGLGAVGIQTDKGKQASDLTSIKQDAVMKALPAAESYALKDAAEKIGDLFGRNLNRKDVMGFSPRYATGDLEDGLLEIIAEADEENLQNIYSKNKDLHRNAAFIAAIEKRKKELYANAQ